MIAYEKDGKTLEPLAQHCERCAEWALFYMFAVTFLNADPVGFDAHIDWVRSRPFDSPDEWLGPEGDRFRALWNSDNPSAEFVERWRNFKTANRAKTPPQIDAMLTLFISGV